MGSPAPIKTKQPRKSFHPSVVVFAVVDDDDDDDTDSLIRIHFDSWMPKEAPL